ncbi:hypothetical protein ACTFIR_007537 [Dictyostelium discoideum]
MEGIKNLPSMIKQQYYMVKLDIKKAYLNHSSYLYNAVKTCNSNVERYNISVIAYFDHLLIVGSTKEECLSNLKKTIDLLVKLGFKFNQQFNRKCHQIVEKCLSC